MEIKVYSDYLDELSLTSRASVTTGGAGTGIAWSGNAQKAIDGNIDLSNWAEAPATNTAACTTPELAPYIQVDFGKLAKLKAVTVFHYYDTGYMYCGNRIQISSDGSDWTTVYDTGGYFGYVETALGKTVAFAEQEARYVRHFLSRNNYNHGIHFMDIRFYGSYGTSSNLVDPLLATVTLDSSAGTTWTQRHPEGVIDGAFAEASSPRATAPACDSTTATPFIAIDLGRTAELKGVTLFHKLGRKYCQQKVEVSMDGINWTTKYDTIDSFGPIETADGNLIVFETFTGRFVKHSLGANDVDTNAHFVEVMVHGQYAETENVLSKGAIAVMGGGHAWTGSSSKAVDGSTKWTSGCPWIDTTETTCRSDDSPYFIDIDLGEEKVITGVVLYHFNEDNRKYCGQKVEVGRATHPILWHTVYDTGADYGPPELPYGNAITFEPTRGRYIRHRMWRSDRSSKVHFGEIVVLGNEIENMLQVSVSDNGEHVWAIQNKKVYYMDGVLVDGTWVPVPDAPPAGHVGVNNNNNAYILNIETPQLMYSTGNPTSTIWTTVPGSVVGSGGKDITEFSISGNNKVFARDAHVTMSYPPWTTHNDGDLNYGMSVATNSDGSVKATVHPRGHIRLFGGISVARNVDKPTSVIQVSKLATGAQPSPCRTLFQNRSAMGNDYDSTLC
ncbi:Glycoside hydrolase family 3 domain protein [Seminavis robusta]|uniref:Glycoside hydrolase family 3 domain protein n=1 Tax=Seminavis robusta TaxID=568900 RepID=A0A9N8F0W6_9STRA|nr:Glycoside hydrolase family 3 domain protein [Seminavis robusta]|eukprot:Sro2270_g321390.1 Glycoside hydrolase family 3 domain protein (671) ;mRNA; f:3032-5535